MEGAALEYLVKREPLNGHALMVQCYTFTRDSTVRQVMLQMVEANVEILWEVASPTSKQITGCITAAKILTFFAPLESLDPEAEVPAVI